MHVYVWEFVETRIRRMDPLFVLVGVAVVQYSCCAQVLFCGVVAARVVPLVLHCRFYEEVGGVVVGCEVEQVGGAVLSVRVDFVEELVRMAFVCEAVAYCGLFVSYVGDTFEAVLLVCIFGTVHVAAIAVCYCVLVLDRGVHVFVEDFVPCLVFLFGVHVLFVRRPVVPDGLFPVLLA